MLQSLSERVFKVTVFISKIILVSLLFCPQSVYESLFYCSSKVTFSLRKFGAFSVVSITVLVVLSLFRSRLTVTLGPQRPIVIKLSCERSVGLSVCPVHCGRTVHRIRTPFGIIGQTGPGMRQVVGFEDRSMEGELLGANLGHAIVHRDL